MGAFGLLHSIPYCIINLCCYYFRWSEFMLDKLLDLLCVVAITGWALLMGYLLGDSLRIIFGINNGFVIYGVMALVAVVIFKLFIYLYKKARG